MGVIFYGGRGFPRNLTSGKGDTRGKNLGFAPGKRAPLGRAHSEAGWGPAGGLSERRVGNPVAPTRGLARGICGVIVRSLGRSGTYMYIPLAAAPFPTICLLENPLVFVYRQESNLDGGYGATLWRQSM